MAPINYSKEEMADMVYCYGLADGNASLAARHYAQRFPNRRLPNSHTFSRLFLRLKETGSVTHSHSTERHYTRPVELEEAVLRRVDENASTSIRRISAQENINKTTVHRILREQLLYPYHYNTVQALTENDGEKREIFCRWAIQEEVVNVDFPINIVFTDEATFTQSGIFNIHNAHVWSDENPHAILETHHQWRFSVNVWAGVIGDQLLGPFFLPKRLTADAYIHFLQNDLTEAFDELPQQILEDCYFMHDYARATRAYLNNRFGNKWIGRGGPPRSPDLNPLDFWFWGHLKQIVYSEDVQNVQDLKNKISNAFDTVKQIPGIFERIRSSFRKRIRLCLEVNGAHIEHLL